MINFNYLIRIFSIMRQILIYFIYIFLSGNIAKCTPLDGFTLFTPSPPTAYEETNTYLVNNDSEIIHQWSHPSRCASTPYLMPDSTLYYPCLITNNYMQIAAAGGRILKYSWDGEIIWDYTWSGMDFIQHHDIEPLPNGNLLILSNERKSMQDAIDRGRINIEGEIWPDMIVEVRPEGLYGGTVVWKWHFWDHLVQNIDSTKINYGNIQENYGKLDINTAEIQGIGPTGQYSGDWLHANSIHYNQIYDQIVISCRRTNEFYIIDHSTTTEEAAGSSGGNSGRGGDFLYRYGNPQNYGRGDSTNMVLTAQHSVNWIPEGYLGENNILIFNNNFTPFVSNLDATSSVIEITPPINLEYNYEINELEPFGPEEFTWYYNGDENFNFLSVIQGGAFRLSNGNTLVTTFGNPTIFEVNQEGQVEWGLNMGNSGIARAQKFDNNYLSNQLAGDMNNDNSIDINDILILINYILGITNSISAQGDIDENEIINIIDLLLIIQIIIH